MVAMGRAIGLPSRKISGIAFRDENWVPHHWAELWLGESIGWTPFDPSTGEAGRIGAAHIALLDSGDVQSIDIKVTDYAPRATQKVDYIARELQWSVGEKRTYGVYRDGKKIGSEIASVRDIEVIDGQELYRFSARSEITDKGEPQITTAQQLLTPQALPRQIILEHQASGKNQVKTYNFTEDTVVIRPGKPGEEVYEGNPGREHPFAKGTYFTDSKLLVHWALMAGQIPLEEGSEKDFALHTFFPEGQTQKEFLLDVGDKEEVSLKPAFGIDNRKADNSGEKTEDKTESDSSSEQKPSDATTNNTDKEPSTENKTEEDSLEKLLKAAENETQTQTQTQTATQLISDSGIEFWLNDRSQIIKIEIPDQGLELILEKVETSLE